MKENDSNDIFVSHILCSSKISISPKYLLNDNEKQFHPYPNRNLYDTIFVQSNCCKRKIFKQNLKSKFDNYKLLFQYNIIIRNTNLTFQFSNMFIKLHSLMLKTQIYFSQKVDIWFGRLRVSPQRIKTAAAFVVKGWFSYFLFMIIVWIA